MPWLRAGDTSAMYPKLLSVVAHASFDERLVNEVAGFLFRCATQAAGYVTDYVVDIGTAYSLAGSRLSVLTDACVQAGLMEAVDVGGVRGWKIIEDPEFLHMKTEEEIAWEKQRKLDNGNPALVIPIRLRDGDACRYCGKVVKWSARKGKLGGTYDHRDAGQPGTVATMVVCCGECNAKRGADPDADRRVPLLAPPTPPYYDKSTIEWINNSTWARDNDIPKLPAKNDKFVPIGSVPPGHESHVPVPAELLLESPASASTCQVDGDGVRGDDSPPPPIPVWLGDGVSVTPAPGVQPGCDGLTGDATASMSPVASTAPRLEPPAPVTPAPGILSGSDGITDDGGRDSSGRAGGDGGVAVSDGGLAGPMVDLPDTADPAGRQCAGSGYAGAGRDGTGLVGSGEVGDGEDSGRRRRRRRRRGRR